MSINNIYIQSIEKQYVDLKNSLNMITEKLSEDQFNTKPAPDKWSVAECIGHLNATWDQYKGLINNAVTQNQNSSVKNSDIFNPRYLMKLFTNMMEPPYKFKMKTFTKFVPLEKFNKQETLNKFNSDVDEFIDYIKIAENVDLKNTIVISPVSKVIKFQLGELFPFLAAHARRHIWQADNVIKIV